MYVQELELAIASSYSQCIYHASLNREAKRTLTSLLSSHLSMVGIELHHSMVNSIWHNYYNIACIDFIKCYHRLISSFFSSIYSTRPRVRQEQLHFLRYLPTQELCAGLALVCIMCMLLHSEVKKILSAFHLFLFAVGQFQNEDKLRRVISYFSLLLYGNFYPFIFFKGATHKTIIEVMIIILYIHFR